MMLTVLIAGLLFAGGAAFAAVRLVRGPTQIDRAVALDVMLAIVVGRDRAARGGDRQLDHPGHRGRRLAAGLHRVGRAGQAAATGPPMTAPRDGARASTAPTRTGSRPMSTIDLIASIALILGALMSLLAGIAVLRFPDTMSRIHAATKPQVLGIMLLMLGVGLRLGSPAVIGMLVLIVVLQFVTAPVSAHLTVRVAYRHATDDQDVPREPIRARPRPAGDRRPQPVGRGGRRRQSPGVGHRQQPAADDGPVADGTGAGRGERRGNPDVDPDEAR